MLSSVPKYTYVLLPGLAAFFEALDQNFFGPSWINRDIEFEHFEASPAKTWTIVRKINEKNNQGGNIDWDDFHTHTFALALFECANCADPSERAFMKIYSPIPFTESMGYSSEERAEQASPEEEIREETALRTLTTLGCESALLLINHKREYQNGHGPVPGGFVVYLMIEQLSGISLNPDQYWTFSDEDRREIREAFEKAYKDCVGHGIAPIDGALGTSLLWDIIQKKIYILSFKVCCEATVEDAWDSHVLLEWGFTKSRPGVSNMRNPLPPSVLADVTINETLWEL